MTPEGLAGGILEILERDGQKMSPMFHFYVVSSFFPNEEFFHNVFFCFVLFVLLVLILKYVHCGGKKSKKTWKP